MEKISIESLAFDNSLWSILIRFFVNLLVLFIIIRVIYYKYSKKEEYLFSFFIMGIMIFLIVSILETIKLQMGMALGLFALFSILRFRTISYSVKEMTYIFAIIGVSVINSQAHIAPHIIGMLSINSIIILTIYILEAFLHKKFLSSFTVTFNKVELLNPALKQDLINDLSLHTGQKIEKVKIRKMDIGKSTCEIEVFFRDKDLN
jgi:Domain of unknown function (DUF4956)